MLIIAIITTFTFTAFAEYNWGSTYGCKYPDVNTESGATYAYNNLNNCGYSIVRRLSTTSDIAYTYLPNDDIFYFIGHTSGKD